jgi:hypothetical protein
MSLRDELLDKAVAGLLTQDEAAQLRDIIKKEEMDARLRTLIALGVGAAAGATLPKLLELDIFEDLLEEKPVEVEELPPEPGQATAGRQRLAGPGPSEYTPFPPEDALEEEMETAREATAPGQVGARPMTAPPPMGERRRPRRPPPIRRV